MPSVRSLRSLWDKKLVLVTGKGGVGKTSMTAALGRAAHRAGRRVLVTEVTPDLHNPSPVLSPFGHAHHRESKPVEMDKGLFGVRLTATFGHRQFLRAALRVKILVDAAMKSAALTRFLLAAPTFPEVGILYQMVGFIRSKDYDHIIVDLPATGHAVALASLPRVVNRIVPGGLIGDAIRDGLECMSDEKRSQAVVVTLPESMPVTETRELITALNDCGIRVGGAVLNRMPEDPFSAEEKAVLQAARAENPGLGGAKELRRLERAIEARQQFYQVIPEQIPRYELPVLDSADDRTLVAKMVEALGQVEGRPPETK